jgi:uroporphyrinogen decarboxylase
MRKLEQTLSGITNSPPPLWLMRQAGRYLPEYKATRAQAGSFMDLCLNPTLAAEVTLQPIRRYGFDAAIIFSDILIIPYALGHKVEFIEGEGPRLSKLPEQFQQWRLELNPKNYQPTCDAIGKTRALLPVETSLIGFCGAPWTVACYMIDGRGGAFRQSKLWAANQPQVLEKLIEILIQASAEYLLAQVQAGANVLQIFDSHAGLLQGEAFKNYVIEPTKQLIALVKAKAPAIKIIGFPRGATGVELEEYATTTGIDAVSLDTHVPLSQAQKIQKIKPVQGLLNPTSLVAGGKTLADETHAILRSLSDGPFIFNLGHGITPDTPPEHVAELVALVRNQTP